MGWKHFIGVCGVWLCYFGIHRFRMHTENFGNVKIIGRRCTRCYYEPMWDR